MGWIAQQSPRPWRLELRMAMFRNVPFHVESGGQTSGRRIAMHEYPKRDVPYAEDMGKRATTFEITGYLIEYDRRLGLDYRRARNQLISALETEGPGTLIHPTLPEMQVMVTGYSVSETRERGGYCVFEMRFIEAGKPANQISLTNTSAAVQNQVNQVNSQGGQVFQDTLSRWGVSQF